MLVAIDKNTSLKPSLYKRTYVLPPHIQHISISVVASGTLPCMHCNVSTRLKPRYQQARKKRKSHTILKQATTLAINLLCEQQAYSTFKGTRTYGEMNFLPQWSCQSQMPVTPPLFHFRGVSSASSKRAPSNDCSPCRQEQATVKMCFNI